MGSSIPAGSTLDAVAAAAAAARTHPSSQAPRATRRSLLDARRRRSSRSRWSRSSSCTSRARTRETRAPSPNASSSSTRCSPASTRFEWCRSSGAPRSTTFARRAACSCSPISVCSTSASSRAICWPRPICRRRSRSATSRSTRWCSVTAGRTFFGAAKAIVIITPNERLDLGVPSGAWPKADLMIVAMKVRRERSASSRARCSATFSHKAEMQRKAAEEARKKAKYYTVKTRRRARQHRDDLEHHARSACASGTSCPTIAFAWANS